MITFNQYINERLKMKRKNQMKYALIFKSDCEIQKSIKSNLGCE